MRTMALIFCLALIVGRSALAGEEEVRIEVTELAPGIHMLQGQGGNIGLVSGGDATFLVDDQYAPLTEKIQAAIAEVTPRPVDFVLNTHWHGDHTGGNENFGEAGAWIVAHHKVRERMSRDFVGEVTGRSSEASPPGALPVVTFGDDLSFHINGIELRAIHVPRAHTDGDTIVLFEGRNVVHAGDVFFNGRYPFIDVDSGGSIHGMISAVEEILTRVDADTLIIPGHGPLGDRSSLEAYRDMLATVRDRVAAAVEAGKSIEGTLAESPTAEFDEQWSWGFIDGERFVRLVYASLEKKAGS